MSSFNLLSCIILSLLIIFIHLNFTYACTCIPSAFKDVVCASESTFLGTVLAKFDNCPTRQCDPLTDALSAQITYIVSVQKHFRGLLIEDSIAMLRTDLLPELCGTSFNVQSTYLFSLTNLINSTTLPVAFHATSCDVITNWTKLSTRLKRFVKRSNKACASS